MTPPHGPAAPGLGRFALAIALLVIWAAVTARLAATLGGEDLAALYIAGQMWAEVGPEGIYAFDAADFYTTEDPRWLVRAEALGLNEIDIFPYVYPPVWAALLAPIATTVDFATVKVVTAWIFFPAFAVAVLAARSLTTPTADPLRYVAVTIIPVTLSLPFLVAFGNIQPHLLITALMLVALERDARGQGLGAAWVAGAALGLAAAIKLSPAILAIWWLVRGRWHALLAFAVVGGGLGLASLVTLGFGIHWRFLERLSEIDGIVLVNQVNIPLETFLVPLPQATDVGHLSIPEPAWVGPLVLAILLLGLAGVLLLARQADEETATVAAPLAILQLSVICGPLAWLYYSLPLMLCLAGLPRLLGGSVLASLTVVAIFGVTILPLANALPGIPSDLELPMTYLAFAANCAALGLCVAALVRSALARRRTPLSEPG